jgi:transcriptional regulator with XRE-family HTH domain
MDDLEFLLSSTCQLGGDAPAKILGMCFARLRQQKNLSITELAHLMDKDEEVILDIEYVNLYRKATLADYMFYADILGCSLREIFDAARLEALQVPLSAPFMRIAQMNEEHILRQIEEIAQLQYCQAR